MKILTIKAPTNFNLFLFGDGHEGNIAKTQKGFKRLVDAVLSPYDGIKTNFAVDHGDIADTIELTDPRYDPDTVTSPLRAQEDACVAERMPFRKQLITVLEGNHTYKSWTIYGGRGGFTRKVCERLAVYYGSYTCKIHFVDRHGKLMFKSFHTHGRKAISSIAHDPIQRWANMKAILKRQLMNLAGDCTLMCKGHTHKLLTSKPQKNLYLVDDGNATRAKYTHAVNTHPTGFIHPDWRWYVNTGSFLRLYVKDSEVSTYSERAEYPPMELGFAVAVVRNREIVRVDRVVIG